MKKYKAAFAGFIVLSLFFGIASSLFAEEKRETRGVNKQITDSVTQANVKVLGDAPAVAEGNLYQATSQALANAAHNATNAQQQSFVTAQAVTTQGVAELYSIEGANEGRATKEIFEENN